MGGSDARFRTLFLNWFARSLAIEGFIWCRCVVYKAKTNTSHHGIVRAALAHLRCEEAIGESSSPLPSHMLSSCPPSTAPHAGLSGMDSGTCSRSYRIQKNVERTSSHSSKRRTSLFSAPYSPSHLTCAASTTPAQMTDAAAAAVSL